MDPGLNTPKEMAKLFVNEPEFFKSTYSIM